MSWCPSVSRASAIADQEGGGATRLSHALNISRRHALHSPALSDLICLSFASSMSSSIPMSSHSPATLRSSLSKTFSRESGVADLEPRLSSFLVVSSRFNAPEAAEAINKVYREMINFLCFGLSNHLRSYLVELLEVCRRG